MAATQQARRNQKIPPIDEALPVEKRACYGMDPDLFVGVDGETTEDRVYREQDAVLVCRQCALISECLAWAMTHGERGVWGGTTNEDRRYLRTGKRRPTYTGQGTSKQQEAKRLRIKIAKDLEKQGLSFEEIAKEIKVTVGTIYGYLKDGDHVETDQGSDEAQAEGETSGSRSSDSRRETTPVLTLEYIGGDHES